MQSWLFSRQSLTQSPAIVDAMRGLAAVLVFASHADAYGMLPIPWQGIWKGVIGEASVDLFFLLSGYLIWISAEKHMPQGVGVYAIHRVTRVAPLYLINLLFVFLAAPLFIGSFHPDLSWSSLLRHLTFTQSLEPSVSRDFNPVLWTLTHEALFYALVPVLWLARRILWLFLPLALVALQGAKHDWFWAFDPFFEVLFLFALGVVLARAKATPGWIALALALIAVILALRYEQSWLAAVLACAFFAGFSCLSQFGARTAAVLWPLSWIGLISYSVYIWHYLLIELLGIPINHVLRHPFLFPPVFAAIVLAVSWASYKFIELPAMTTLRAA